MREIRTSRLLLRRLRRDDARTIFETWANDPEVTRFLTWEPHGTAAVTEAVVDMWLADYERPETYRFAIERLFDGALMGMIDVVGFRNGHPVIGYCSGKKYWGCGYMSEALGAVVHQLFEDGYETIEIYAAVKNIGSNRVIEKNGFVFTGQREPVGNECKPDVDMINMYRLDRQ